MESFLGMFCCDLPGSDFDALVTTQSMVRLGRFGLEPMSQESCSYHLDTRREQAEFRAWTHNFQGSYASRVLSSLGGAVSSSLQQVALSHVGPTNGNNGGGSLLDPGT